MRMLVIVLLCLISFSKSYHFFPKNALKSLPSHLRANLNSGPLISMDPLLIRSYRGESVERIPIWLMRQAGRFMPQFREYSDKYSFRHRSETPDIATKLSLLPWQHFDLDGVIMFSDILTPLAPMGINFDIVEGKGPQISNPIRTMTDVKALIELNDFETQLPFIGTILKNLRNEIAGRTALLGFIGSPWTLAAYSIEGHQASHLSNMMKMTYQAPEILQALLNVYSNSLARYANYQIECGAQAIQIFESWAHHMNEDLFRRFALPSLKLVLQTIREKHPNVPLIYFANGGSAYWSAQLELPVDSWSLDYKISLRTARNMMTWKSSSLSNKTLAGNLDPQILVIPDAEQVWRTECRRCLEEGSEGGSSFVFNLGHGVEKTTSPKAVEILVDECRQFKLHQ